MIYAHVSDLHCFFGVVSPLHIFFEEMLQLIQKHLCWLNEELSWFPVCKKDRFMLHKTAGIKERKYLFLNSVLYVFDFVPGRVRVTANRSFTVGRL